MHILGIIQWVGYPYVFRALWGVFELTIMADCYDLYSKDSGLTLSMCHRNFGSNILRIWFKVNNV